MQWNGASCCEFNGKSMETKTTIEPLLLEQSNETSWVSPALKSTSHFLPQCLCNETGDPNVNLIESQWKLGQQHDQNFPTEGKPL